MKSNNTGSTRKFSNLLYVFMLMGLILGGYVSARETPLEFTRFSMALDLILRKASSDLDEEKLIFNAIDGMLNTLDPHTHFLDPTTFALMTADQEGKFSGIGIAFDIRNGKLTVVAPIENTPAYKLGIRAGDIITEIEGESTANITESEVINKLRGVKGTTVNITVQRVGINEPLHFAIVRADIPLESVKYPTLLTDDIGYIRIIRFAKHTPAELEKHLKELESKGMKKLIIDMRSNYGGLLDSAVQVATKFLEPGQMIVYTKGRIPDSNRSWKAPKGVNSRKYPIIVLVEHNTASGAEIVAGAIQDWDRGLIIGQTTYGKGLVQRLFREKMNSAIQVTTSQYFTPSGRNIQKLYDTVHRKYFRKFKQEEKKISEESTAKKTYVTELMNREVYGGGGITPDIKIEPPDYPLIVSKMAMRFLFFDFAILYTNNNPNIPKTLEITPEIIFSFKEFLKKKNFEYDESDFIKNIINIKNRLLVEIIGAKYGQNARFHVILKHDPMIQEAITYFPQAEELNLSAQSMLKR